MASVKAQLKAIGDAVKRNQFDDAIEQINALLQKDPKNYLAYVAILSPIIVWPR